jgi:hypothetical protein
MPRARGMFLGLLLLCSCATENSVHSQLPATVAMNKDAGRLQPMFVTLQLEDGKGLPCLLDTGAPVTALDQSLEPKLGKRFSTESVWAFDGKHEGGIYPAPKIYLGGTLLQHTGTNICTFDCKPFSTAFGRPVMGILGMDVLEHYCMQLDFASRRIRFLDAEHASKKVWGKPFVLTAPPEGGIYISNNLGGNKGSGSLTLIDTGFLGDGWLAPALFQQWTNQALPLVAGQVHCPNARLGGETYPEVWLDRGESWETGEPEHNGVGILFLSRHLVTLDFPRHTLYLKRTSIGPLHLDTQEVKAEGKSAATLLSNLKKSGHLPGWSKDDKSVAKSASFSCRSTLTGSLTVRKIGDSSVYHFQVIRASEDSPWKLQKAWRSDKKGNAIEEYPVP